MINEAAALKIDHGVYSSPSQWDPIMGGATFASHLPIWVRRVYTPFTSRPVSMLECMPFTSTLVDWAGLLFSSHGLCSW